MNKEYGVDLPTAISFLRSLECFPDDKNQLLNFYKQRVQTQEFKHLLSAIVDESLLTPLLRKQIEAIKNLAGVKI